MASHEHHASYLTIMQSNVTMMERVIINRMVEVAWNISRNGYGNAIIGRYGGCFEEGMWWVYGTGKICVALERLAMVEG